MKGKAIISIAILSIAAGFSVSEAIGPGEGQMTKRNIAVSQDGCIADSVTVRWDLDSLLGEPTVNGTYMYSGNCKPGPRFVIWLQVEHAGGRGWVRLAPATPNGPGSWGFNVAGSPDWDEVLCGYDGTRKTSCHDPSSAKDMWKNGRVTDFHGPWEP